MVAADLAWSGFRRGSGGGTSPFADRRSGKAAERRRWTVFGSQEIEGGPRKTISGSPRAAGRPPGAISGLAETISVSSETISGSPEMAGGLPEIISSALKTPPFAQKGAFSPISPHT